MYGNAKQSGATSTWAISSSAKAAYDDIFRAWDVTRSGYVGGDKARAIFGNSGLPDSDLFHIWRLVDSHNNGKLNPDEFAVAMHLIQMRMSGAPLFNELPPELVPPSTRDLDQMANLLKFSLAVEGTGTRASRPRELSINQSSNYTGSAKSAESTPPPRQREVTADNEALSRLQNRKYELEKLLSLKKAKLAEVLAANSGSRSLEDVQGELARLQELKATLAGQSQEKRNALASLDSKLSTQAALRDSFRIPESVTREFQSRKERLNNLLILVSELKSNSTQSSVEIKEGDRLALESMQTSLVSLHERYKVEGGKRLSLAQQIARAKQRKVTGETGTESDTFNLNSIMIPKLSKEETQEDAIAAKARQLLEQRMAALGIKSAPVSKAVQEVAPVEDDAQRLEAMKEEQDSATRAFDKEIHELQYLIEKFVTPNKSVDSKVLDRIGSLKLHLDTLVSRIDNYASKFGAQVLNTDGFFAVKSSAPSPLPISIPPAPPTAPPPVANTTCTISPSSSTSGSESTNPFSQAKTMNHLPEFAEKANLELKSSAGYSLTDNRNIGDMGGHYRYKGIADEPEPGRKRSLVNSVEYPSTGKVSERIQAYAGMASTGVSSSEYKKKATTASDATDNASRSLVLGGNDTVAVTRVTKVSEISAGNVENQTADQSERWLKDSSFAGAIKSSENRNAADQAFDRKLDTSVQLIARNLQQAPADGSRMTTNLKTPSLIATGVDGRTVNLSDGAIKLTEKFENKVERTVPEPSAMLHDAKKSVPSTTRMGLVHETNAESGSTGQIAPKPSSAVVKTKISSANDTKLSSARQPVFAPPSNTAERVRQQVMGYKTSCDDESDSDSSWGDSSESTDEKVETKLPIVSASTSTAHVTRSSTNGSASRTEDPKVLAKSGSNIPASTDPSASPTQTTAMTGAPKAEERSHSIEQSTPQGPTVGSLREKFSSVPDQSFSGSFQVRSPTALKSKSHFSQPGSIDQPPGHTASLDVANTVALPKSPKVKDAVTSFERASSVTSTLPSKRPLVTDYPAKRSPEFTSQPPAALSKTKAFVDEPVESTKMPHSSVKEETQQTPLLETVESPYASTMTLKVGSLKDRLKIFESTKDNVNGNHRLEPPKRKLPSSASESLQLGPSNTNLAAFMPTAQNLEKLKVEASDLQLVEAQWDYSPTCHENIEEEGALELTLIAGMRYCVLETQSDWAFGYAVSRPDVRGWFPNTYVAPVGGKELTRQTAIKSAVVLYDFEAEGYPELSVSKGQLVHCQEASDYGHEWMWVSLKDDPQREGIVPSSFLGYNALPNSEKRVRTLSIKEKLHPNFSQQLEASVRLSHSRSLSSDMLAPIASTLGNSDKQKSKDSGAIQPKRPEMKRWVNCVSKEVAQSLNEQDRKRQEAIFEIILTEQSYVNDLRLLNDTLLPILSKHLNPSTVKSIVGNVKEIMTANELLLTRMLEMQQKDRFIIAKIGPLFVSNYSLLQSYKNYCAMQMNATRVLESSRKSNAKLQDDLKEVQATRAEFRHLDISSFLLQPMQRITRYALLLKQLLHYTGRYHQDHAPLTEALTLIEGLLAEINDAASKAESEFQIAAIVSQLSNEGSGFRVRQLLTTEKETKCLGERTFVFQGPLVKYKSGRKLEGLLFNDMLVLVTRYAETLQVYREPLALNGIAARDIPAPIGSRSAPTSADDRSFQIIDGENIIQLRANSAADRAKWVKLLDQYCSAFIKAEKQLLEGEQNRKLERERAISSQKSKPPIGTLKLTLIDGFQLSAARSRGDVYCVVQLGEQQFKSRIVHDIDTPRWNQTVVFSLNHFSEQLCFSVFSCNKYSQDVHLGNASISLAFLEYFGEKETDAINLNFVETPRAHISIKLGFHNI